VTRTATRSRSTSETTIELSIDLDGSGVTDIATGIPFFDHMLTLFARHSLVDLTVKTDGDIEVDFDGLPAADAAGERIREILDSPTEPRSDLWFHLFVLVEGGFATVPPQHRAQYERWSDLARASIASSVLVYLTPNYYPASPECPRPS